VKAIRCVFLVALLAPMFGCGLLRTGSGLEEYKAEDGTTKVRSTGADPAGMVANLLGILGPWGIAAGAGIKLGSKYFAHREIIAHGQKDDNMDGIPDDEQQPDPRAQGTV
jgi:zona occludens toxin (predicted ATPase)